MNQETFDKLVAKDRSKRKNVEVLDARVSIARAKMPFEVFWPSNKPQRKKGDVYFKPNGSLNGLWFNGKSVMRVQQ